MARCCSGGSVSEAVAEAQAAAVEAQQAAIAAQGGGFAGAGSPEGVVTANVGALYTDTANTLGARLWRKNTGSGNTGWFVVDGDTGWRLVTASHADVTLLYIRRLNNTVHFQASINRAAATTVAIYTVPTGFQYAPSFFDGRWYTPSSTVLGYVSTVAGGTSLQHTTPSIHNFGSSGWSYPVWNTAAQLAWPLSLPGTAAP